MRSMFPELRDHCDRPPLRSTATMRAICRLFKPLRSGQLRFASPPLEKLSLRLIRLPSRAERICDQLKAHPLLHPHSGRVRWLSSSKPFRLWAMTSSSQDCCSLPQTRSGIYEDSLPSTGRVLVDLDVATQPVRARPNCGRKFSDRKGQRQ